MLGLPPAFVLSQDQTLKFDLTLLSGAMEENPCSCCSLGSQSHLTVLPEGFTLRLRVEKKHKRTLHSVCPNQQLLTNLNRQDSAAHVSLSFVSLCQRARPKATDQNCRIELIDPEKFLPCHGNQDGHPRCREALFRPRVWGLYELQRTTVKRRNAFFRQIPIFLHRTISQARRTGGESIP